MGEMEELLARVEKATGPDRELSRAVYRALGWTPNLVPGGMWLDPSGPPVREPADCTASLDAALALVERVLPGWEIRATLHDPHVRINNRAHTIDVGALGATPALALLAACLRALIKEKTNG